MKPQDAGKAPLCEVSLGRTNTKPLCNRVLAFCFPALSIVAHLALHGERVVVGFGTRVSAFNLP